MGNMVVIIKTALSKTTASVSTCNQKNLNNIIIQEKGPLKESYCT